EWASQIEEVEIRETDDQGRGVKVWYRVDAKVLELEYVLGYTYHDDHRLTWSLDQGEQLRQLDGEYRLVPEDDAVRVHYRLAVDLTVPVPGFLKKRAAKKILESGLDELKRRSESMV
ncbi:MAG TPA: SRPBCC family protein, partial [Nitriliruptorales bacterium]|nr:SRPBCC family protein [Nitriliruptorales bacterium]